MQIKDFYEYSVLADLSYVDWNDNNKDRYELILEAAQNPKKPKRPEAIVEEFFDTKGWKITSAYENDDVGFKASLFTHRVSKTGHSIFPQSIKNLNTIISIC